MAAFKQIQMDTSVIYEKPIEQVMHESMIPYSESVILDRALPRVEDGLKPVQRRILYAMYELGLAPDKPHRKCAKIVGDCLGKYHPHGDSSVYDALVRMAQSFNMRKTLVDGHGNFGSIDGDSAAAYRYTEARLSPIALELLRDIDKDTVEWQWNFDDTIKEPVLLPSRFPNLLVNGSMGIAVGLATNIPPHNLNEVIDGVIALIERPKIKLEEMMEIIKGPDFPTGGSILVGDDLKTAYETGRGRVTMVAKTHIEAAENDKKNIVITELPYQVQKAALLQRILALREERKEILGGIVDIVDESDRNGMRAVIKVKRDADANKIVAYLMKYTNLRLNFNFNMVAIADGKPKQMGLLEILGYYLNHQRNVVERRCQFDLKAAKIRAEIVQGLLVAIANIDEVIKIIKSSANATAASENLRARFGLTERQAQAILEMKLRRLTGLDVETLQDELKQLEKTIEELTAILNSKRLLNNLIKTELVEVKKAHKTPRETVIMSDSEEYVVPYKSDEAAYKEGIVVLNDVGTVKFVTTRGFGGAARRASDVSPDSVVKQAVYINNRQKLVAISDFGNCYKLSPDDLPEKKYREKGASLANLSKDAKADEKIVALFAADNFPLGECLMFTKNGMVKRSKWEDLNVSKSAYKVINLDDDTLVSVATADENKLIFTATKQGMCLEYELSEIPVQGRNAGGVKSIQLNDGDEVIFASQITEEGEILVVTDQTFAKRVFSFSFELSKRYRKGLKLVELPDKHFVALVDYVTKPFDIAILAGEEVVGYSTEDVKIDSRTARGKALASAKRVEVKSHVVDYTK